MSGVNKAILIGHLGADPQARTTQSGGKLVSFRIATSETWKDKATGERKEATQWHTIVVFNEGLAGIAEKYLKKGSKVYVEGMIMTRKWTGQDGIDRWSTEIVLKNFNGTLTLLDRAERAPAPDENAYGESERASAATQRPSTKQELDDEIPF